MDWTYICRVDEVPADDVLPLSVEGRDLAVCGVGGMYFVFVDRCTHEDVPLSTGFLEGWEIECPKHGARFDVRTGRCLKPPADEDIATFATKVEEGAVYAQLGGPTQKSEPA